MTNKNVTEFRAKLEEKISKEEAKKAIQTILKYIGENPDREGLIETPKRVIKAFDEYFSGYAEDPQLYLEKTFGDVEGYDDMVIQKNISIQSHCEHHMAPIIGIAHVAYIPSEKVVGLSKLARVVEAYSRRLQTQERLTMQIANAINKGLRAHGTAVCIDAVHQCMTTRGVMKENATTVTNYFTGSFRDSQSLQQRFLSYINKSNV
jgi:GTP cyclohydrolase I